MKIKEVIYKGSACFEGVFSPVEKTVVVVLDANEKRVSSEAEKWIIDDIIESVSYGAKMMKNKMGCPNDSKLILDIQSTNSPQSNDNLLNTPVPKNLAPNSLHNSSLYGLTLKACNLKELEFYAYVCKAAMNKPLGNAAKELLTRGYRPEN